MSEPNTSRNQGNVDLRGAHIKAGDGSTSVFGHGNTISIVNHIYQQAATLSQQSLRWHIPSPLERVVSGFLGGVMFYGVGLYALAFHTALALQNVWLLAVIPALGGGIAGSICGNRLWRLTAAVGGAVTGFILVMLAWKVNEVAVGVFLGATLGAILGAILSAPLGKQQVQAPTAEHS